MVVTVYSSGYYRKAQRRIPSLTDALATTAAVQQVSSQHDFRAYSFGLAVQGSEVPLTLSGGIDLRSSHLICGGT